jgi:Domain of unknown function (DUF4214)
MHQIMIACVACGQFLLAGCSDKIAGPSPSSTSLAVSTVLSAPYPSSDTLPSIALTQKKFGANGHSATQVPYKDAAPDGLMRTFDALRGLAGTIYRFDVPRLDGDSAQVWTQRTQAALHAAQARGVRVVIVLPTSPDPSLSVSAAFILGSSYANGVIPVLQPYLSVIDAVELGNELEVTTPGMIAKGVPGTVASDYNTAILNTAAAYYRGMRQAFVNAGGAVAAVPRLVSATSGHTYWVRQALALASVQLTRTGVDGIAWHWYTTGSGGYLNLTSNYVAGGSVMSRLRSWYGGTNKFRLWVTETSSEYPDSVYGACPHDDQVQTVASRIGPLYASHASLPEVEAIIAYEIFDQNTTGTDREHRYGFAVSGCAAVGNQIGYKTSADSLALATFRLRDMRKILAAATVLGLGGAATIEASDTVALPSAALNAANRGALVNAMESSVTRSRWLTNLYKAVHRRAPDPSGFGYWQWQLSQPGWDRHRVEAEFYASDEYFATNGGSDDAFVWALYRDIHARQNDPDGVWYWVWRLQTGTSRFEVARSFLASPEHVDVVVQLTHARVLDRAASATELDFWRSRLFGSVTLEDMVYTLIRTNEAVQVNAVRRLSAHRQ